MGLLIRNGTAYGGLAVDTELSTTSTNPVQNKAVANAINTLNTDKQSKTMSQTISGQTTVESCLSTINANLSAKQPILGIGTYTGNIDMVGGGSGQLPSESSICWINSHNATGGHPAEFYILETYPVETGTILQRATQYVYQDAPRVFTRMFLNNAWSVAWKEL